PVLMPGAPPLRADWRQWLEFAVITLATVAMSGWIFLSGAASEVLVFPILLPVIWAGIRFGAIRTSLITVIIISLAGYGSSRGTGVFDTATSLTQRSLNTQLLIGTVAVIAVTLVVVTRHRAQLAARAQEGEKTLRRAIRDALVGMYS